ncbi:MAG: glycosyltransferase family 2 protein [Cyanobacteriota bacterium]
MNQQEIDVSIVLPTYNEEKALLPVIEEIRDALKDLNQSYEILVIDDNSTDKTLEIAKQLADRVIKRSINGGAGAARKTGIANARGNIIVMLDADGTYNPYDIPAMLELFPAYDQVNGSRDSEQGTLKLLRIPAKWFIRKLASILTNTDIPDLNTGLKAFKKDKMQRFLWVIPDGFSCVTSMTLAFLCNGLSVTWVPTTYKKRIGKSKFKAIKDTYNYILTVIRIIMYFNPLNIFLPLSLIILIIGIIKSLYDRLYGIGYLQQSDIIILLTAILIGILGLLADLIVVQSKSHIIDQSFFIKEEEK